MNNTYNAIFLVIITVIFQLILLFPDIVNKYFPVDIKLKKFAIPQQKLLHKKFQSLKEQPLEIY